ncbi:peroxidasin homolog [Mytilus edulis]|uniref:peroxidasin homolog n=1 Tax=Mytilus edulis TaxID=6550 RepID=UPI0039EDE825
MITQLSFRTQRIRCSIDDPSLKIEISKTTDAGVYKCCAQNSAGTGFSIDISLIVNDKDYIPEETITCISQQLGYEWRNIMIKLDAVKEEDLEEISQQYPENTPAQIKECLNRFIRKNKENPDLIYHLIAILDSFNRKDLVDEVRQQLDSPLITMKQRRCTSKLGNTIEVACDVRSSSSISRIYWTKNTEGNPKTIHHSSKGFNGITIDNPSLVLDNIRQTDEGVYECFAENEAGVGRGDAIEVTVVSDETADSDIPDVEIRFPNYKVELGQSVTLQCTIHSIKDIVSVIWMKHTTETSYSINSKSPGKSGSTPEKPSLTIKSVSMTDIGSYICCASNDVGIGNSKPIKLEILEGIVKSSLTVNKTTISIKEGTLFNEKVEAVAVITNPALNLSERYISKNISRLIGKTLQIEVTKHYPNGVQHGTIVVTTVENLRCKSILLCALDDGLNDKNIQQAQRHYLHNCLTEASKKGITSIAIPTCYSLPEGKLSNLSIRALVCSQYLFLKEFIKENYNTTLTDIRIIIDKHEYNIIKEFEEAARTIKVTGVPVVLQKFKDISVKYLSVKLCHGDIENFDVDVIVHYVTPLINQNANELSVSLFKLGGLEFQRVFDEKVFKKYSNKIAVGGLIPCEGGNLKCERIYNCCLSVTNPLVPHNRQQC